MPRQKTVFETGPSAAAMREKNPDNFNPGFQRNRYRVDEEIYIFSTAKRDFEVSQTLFPKVTLRGCRSGERFVLATVVPDPVPQASPDLERGGARMDYEDGWTAAMGLLNPEIPQGMSDWKAAAEAPTTSIGVNLLAQGLFPSLTNPPKEEDVRAAENVRDKRYRRLCDEAFRAAATSSKKLSDFLREHEDVHDAMDALGLEADWHRKRQVTMNCPNCGDAIPTNVAFHRSSVTQKLCILDAERAYKSKAITKEEYEELVTAPA